MGLRQLIEQKKEDILRLAGEHGAKNVRVFGSVARGDTNLPSDRIKRSEELFGE